ncbi:TIGR02452 family protein [Streptacidiphilus sp. PB12-B1b]|uniref:TIGR02452 family protein n=1 Tax=Streptacidiphilus sp. PB12-B1b TaxID=2705012 RepID=UPI0015F9C2B1|nr:TIGR02452 family protein [Streptacidiphilus sp. PB12-B1b]QMU78071.1 TIGR02452 family protein [Streptacidiphilus sp. PB12-B1b]
MSSRMRGVAAVNEAIVEAGWYRAEDGTRVEVRAVLEAAAAGTRCHLPEERLDPPSAAAPVDAGAVRVEVTAEGSLQAARRLCARGGGEVAVLNFASARNPGGGYLGGAKAQEEDLCRQALLYSCLLHAPEYYAAHRAGSDLLYSDRVIWSPRVPVHRGDDGGLVAQPPLVSFLTCPAPNAGEFLRRDPHAGALVGTTLRRRAGRVLAVAAHHGVRRLVLGAWGCGVFRNDPREVARAFHHHLGPDGAFRTGFDEIVFAVWDRRTPSPNRAAFTAAFAPPSP